MKSVYGWEKTVIIVLSCFLLSENVYADAVKSPLTFSYSIFPIAIGVSFIIFLIAISILMIRNIKNGMHNDDN